MTKIITLLSNLCLIQLAISGMCCRAPVKAGSAAPTPQAKKSAVWEAQRPLVAYVQKGGNFDVFPMFADRLVRDEFRSRSPSKVALVIWPNGDESIESWSGQEAVDHLESLGDIITLGPATPGTDMARGLKRCDELADQLGNAEILVISGSTGLSYLTPGDRKALKEASHRRTVHIVWFEGEGDAKDLASGFAATVSPGTVDWEIPKTK